MLKERVQEGNHECKGVREQIASLARAILHELARPQPWLRHIWRGAENMRNAASFACSMYIPKHELLRSHLAGY